MLFYWKVTQVFLNMQQMNKKYILSIKEILTKINSKKLKLNINTNRSKIQNLNKLNNLFY